MRKPIHVVVLFICCIVLSWKTAPAATSASQEEISWQEASSEVDEFPYTDRFVDSVRNVHNVFLRPQPLRMVVPKSVCEPETLVYSVGWGPFNAGYVVLTVVPDKENGTIELGAKALSNNFISVFYRMRDYIITTVDAQGLYPCFFEEHLREGKRYKVNSYALFDHVGGKVLVQGRTFKSVDVPSFVQNYISVLYYLRKAVAFAPGDTFTEQLFVHGKVHPIFFKVKKSDPVKVDAGTFPCMLLEPKLAGEGRAFNKRDKLEVWVSDDNRQMPVHIKSKIKFGSINAKLVWYSRSEQPVPAVSLQPEE